MQAHNRVSAGPPQIINVDFQLSDLTTSRWLCQEIRNAGSCAPFINTTGGCKSNCSGAVAAAAPAPVDTEAGVATTAGFTRPAAAQAAGLVMPAFINAAVIVCCSD